MNRDVCKTEPIKRNNPTKKWISFGLALSVALSFALVCLFGAMLTMTAHASWTTQTAVLEVRQEFYTRGSTPPPSDTFSYVLTAKSAAYPMPEGSVDSRYTFTISGSAQATISGITFRQAGIYRYTLTCVTEDAEGFTVDRQTYNIRIYVTNYRGIIIAIYRENEEKADSILFNHRYVSEDEDEDDAEDDEDEEVAADPPIKEDHPGDSPDTGDDSNLQFWVTLMASSWLLILVLKRIGFSAKTAEDKQ